MDNIKLYTIEDELYLDIFNAAAAATIRESIDLPDFDQVHIEILLEYLLELELHYIQRLVLKNYKLWYVSIYSSDIRETMLPSSAHSLLKDWELPKDSCLCLTFHGKPYVDIILIPKSIHETYCKN